MYRIGTISPGARGTRLAAPAVVPRVIRRLSLPALFVVVLLAARTAFPRDQVPVRHVEGLVHGFLVLRALDGTRLADGDLFQEAHGANVTARAAFRFRDGSRHVETAVFEQRRTFRLLTDHLVQSGPSFPQPLDMMIDVPRRVVSVTYPDHGGRDKMEVEHMDLPDDLANGIIPVLLKNVDGRPPTSVAYVAAMPKPRLVRLLISSPGEEAFTTGGLSRHAIHYVLKVSIGGLAGVLAPLAGKQPPDSHVWILAGAEPAFVKSEQPLYVGGPVWRIELVSPVGPKGEEPTR